VKKNSFKNSYMADINNGAKKVKQAIIALEGLKYINERLRPQVLMVLDSYLDARLQILPHIALEHGPHTLQRIADAQRTKVADQPLTVQQMAVDDCPLDVVQVRVEFESALQESSLFAQLGDVVAVKVAEHFVDEYGVSHLWVAHQVHFEQARL